MNDSKSIPNKASVASTRPEKTVNTIANLFENKEGFGLDSIGSFGLGFRAAMPKMPSFRKIVSLIFLLHVIVIS